MPQKNNSKTRQIIGWAGVMITVVFSGVWSYWGIVENFHEGWYSVSVWENLAMLFLQYLLFTAIFSGLGCLSLRFPRIGFAAYIVLAVFTIFFFSGSSFQVAYLLLALPLILLGLLYLFGRPKPRKIAYMLIICVPLLIIIIVGSINYAKVSKRVDDGNYGMRTIAGNELTLTVAPKGPGWPDEGVSYFEAVEICKYLSEDGTKILDEEQNIWRLPTVDEAVRLMSLHGENCEGVLDYGDMKAVYRMIPDKESPMWDVNSQIIYYWTAEMTSENRAYIIVYDGAVFDKPADANYNYLGFRAVKNTQ